MSRFQKAVKRKKRLRMALMGPSGSGKTYTALAVAAGLGARVAVLCTEFGSASLYADKFPFDVVDMDNFDPRDYVDLIREAGQSGYDCIVVDSLSHAWNGKGGALELVDKAAKRIGGGNSFAGWRDVTPLHNALVDAMLSSPCHVIATLRTKQDYVIEEDSRGKKVPRKIGLAPVQRDGLEYEFDVVADLNLEHDFIVTKTRCDLLDGFVVNRAGADLAKTLLSWLEGGSDAPAIVTQTATPPTEVRPLAQFLADAAKYGGVTVAQLIDDVFAGLLEDGKVPAGLLDDDGKSDAIVDADRHDRKAVRATISALAKHYHDAQAPATA